jgi:ubiquinone/menaquinone biosynthesis C-methylase UbiE
MESGRTAYIFDSDNECARLERQAALLSPERLLRLVAPPPAAAILDAGCGSGAVSRLIAKRHRDARVTGVDLSPAFVADAARRAAAESLSNLTFETGDIAALRFADASVDLIWTQFVLYFLPRPELALAEFRRLLRPGGRMVAVLHEDPMMKHEPRNSELDARLQQVIPRLVDIGLVRRLPMMLRALGFRVVVVEVELDPIYTAIGPIGAAQRRNLAEILGSARGRIAEILGGAAAADSFLADLLAFLDDPGTSSYTTLWMVAATAP